MPTGFADSLTPAAAFIEWLQPKRVLDIGVGNGRMGFLVREYGNKEGVPNWRPGPQRLVGVEGYQPYLGPLHGLLYDEILIGDALDLLPQISDGFDLVIAADIIEHFADAEAETFLDHTTRLGRAVLLVTPSFDMPQVNRSGKVAGSSP